MEDITKAETISRKGMTSNGDYGGRTKKSKAKDYEVYMNFRGPNTRKGFADYLYTSLVDAGVHVFRDGEICVGGKIGFDFPSVIAQTKISIVIISENFASRAWCLKELADILECRRSRGQLVLPIYYKVKPSQLKYLTGRFRGCTDAHKRKMGEIVEWKEALRAVCSLRGWKSQSYENGMKEHWDCWNLGKIGIGKTTLARVLYNKLSSHFKHLSFVANIRETSLHKGIECLQRQFIDDILRSPNNVSIDKISVIKSQFIDKKVLVLLDDIDAITEFNALIGDISWVKVGSIVIVTTRNKKFLDEAKVDHKYEVNKLTLNESLILFSRHAFQKDYPIKGYEILSHSIVSITAGLPLALKVIDDMEQQICLDIACFLIGSFKQSPTYMWDACGFFPRNGIEVLSCMPFIEIDEDDKLRMHDQLRDLGQKIVHLENPKEPQERSRLWKYEETAYVLDSNKVSVFLYSSYSMNVIPFSFLV
ncbi:hypothetical protein EUGRSUZ_L03709 [Eucalyptus grandis]|uniref:TIR domain-containing protein n=1 Tax=Eucalyptus grandis TaxID=71139 RepID=A0AAD9T812_EUCGR|nr:hypothetical protein EUGRSUZ_L03709 [Eucalyptus grandis]